MKIHTFTGRSYVVSSAAGATVTTPTGVVLLTVSPGSQGAFVAPGGEVDITDDAALCTLASGAVLTSAPAFGGESLGIDSLYEHKDNADVHVTPEDKQAWNFHIADDSTHVSDDEREVWNAKPSEETVRAIAAEVADAAVSQEGNVSLSIGGGDDKINAVSIELDACYAPEARVSSIAIRCRDEGEISSEPVFLGAFEQVSGDSYKLIAVSDNAITQQLGEWSVWSFTTLSLSGKRMRYAALAAPDTPFSEASTLYLRCTARRDEDSTLIHTSSRPYTYVPEMVIQYVGRVARFAPASHPDDTSVHLSEREREMINNLNENPPRDGIDGTPGESAFQIWKRVNNLPDATEADFLASLKGERGDKGEKGEPGENGESGESGTLDEETLKYIIKDMLYSEATHTISGATPSDTGTPLSYFSWASSRLTMGMLKAVVLKLASAYTAEPVRLALYSKRGFEFDFLALSLPAKAEAGSITFPFVSEVDLSNVQEYLHGVILSKWDANSLDTIANDLYLSGGVGFEITDADMLGEVPGLISDSGDQHEYVGSRQNSDAGLLAIGSLRTYGSLQL